jgi:putative Mn2+ efflux pump MntP
MHAAAVLTLAAGLAVDSSLAALAEGLAARERRFSGALRLALVFGAFQGGFAVLGWLAGTPVAAAIGEIDHWIAFGVLAGLGVATMRARPRISAGLGAVGPLVRTLAAAVATSVDAAVAGFGLELAGEPVTLLAASTAIFTALGATAAYLAGGRIGSRWQRSARIGAGLALIAIGASILRQHLA